ncbi:phospholipase A1 1-like [Aphomia sociella]
MVERRDGRLMTCTRERVLAVYPAVAELNCVSPPLECPNVNVTFWLYTRDNIDNPHELFALDNDSLETAPWIKDAPVKVISHGYTGDKDFAPNTELRPAYMQCCDYNIISIDYNPIARSPCYISAAKNTELVGKCTAQLIDELVQNHGFKLADFHLIGFSLGGQVVGFVANYIESGKFTRITALDPALPLFVTGDKSKKIDAGDADFVDVLHTNCLERGKLEASGSVDFYANGCINQPGCTTTANQSSSSCSHRRAPKYFAESILTDVGFYARKCNTWISGEIGLCDVHDTKEEIIFGEYVSHDASGLYFFATNSEPPYAQGRSNSTS